MLMVTPVHPGLEMASNHKLCMGHRVLDGRTSSQTAAIRRMEALITQGVPLLEYFALMVGEVQTI